MLRALIFTILLASGCSANRPPVVAPSSACTECETLLRATIVDSIKRDKDHTAALATSHAKEKIATARAETNSAWAAWGPPGLAAAFFVGVLAGMLIR